MFGHVDSKVKAFEPYEIGEVNPKTISEENKDILIQQREEMERRLRDGFPRFRNVQPHEEKDKEYLEEKAEASGGTVSLIQLARKYRDERKIKLKSQLDGCYSNCETTCDRSSIMKEEDVETCNLRCQLACATNIVNLLLS
jgi:hypothetical protein